MPTENDTDAEGNKSDDDMSADIGETRIPIGNLSFYIQNKRKENNGFKTEFLVLISTYYVNIRTHYFTFVVASLTIFSSVTMDTGFT